MNTANDPPKTSQRRRGKTLSNAYIKGMATKNGCFQLRKDPENYFQYNDDGEINFVANRIERPFAQLAEVKAAVSDLSPPAIAEAISYILTKPRLREAVVGTRSEDFTRRVHAYGRKRAVRFYWLDTSKDLWPFSKRVVRWVKAGDLIRRLFGA